MVFTLNWDLFVLLANICLTVGIIPQLIKNYRTKNVESHCVFWHISTIIGMCLLMVFYGYKLNLWITTISLGFTITFRFTMIYQILKYKVRKHEKTSLEELWDNKEDDRWNKI